MGCVWGYEGYQIRAGERIQERDECEQWNEVGMYICLKREASVIRNRNGANVRDDSEEKLTGFVMHLKDRPEQSRPIARGDKSRDRGKRAHRD